MRVNRPWRLLVPDLETAVGPGVQALMLPKIESADHLRLIAETVDEQALLARQAAVEARGRQNPNAMAEKSPSRPR